MPDILKCRIEDTHSLQLVVPSPGVSEGKMGMINKTVYAWLEDYATGELGIKIIEAERIVLPKVAATVFAVGDWVFFDPVTSTLTTTASGHYRCGVCRAAAAASTTTVEVDFTGNNAIYVP